VRECKTKHAESCEAKMPALKMQNCHRQAWPCKMKKVGMWRVTLEQPPANQ